jgi:hypothetical protein
VGLVALTAQAAPFEFDDDPDPALPTHYVSLQTGINVGLLELSMQSGHFVAGFSTTVGWPTLSSGQYFVGDFRFGYAWALSPPDETMWFFDLVADVLPGRIAQSSGGFGRSGDRNEGLFCAGGIALGFRYLHRSGLVVGFRLPLVGLGFGDFLSRQHDGNFDFGTSMAAWYLALGMSSSLVTLGLRF